MFYCRLSLLLQLAALLLFSRSIEGRGGEIAAFNVTPSDNNTDTLRQNFCTRFERLVSTNDELQLKDALSGLSIRPVLEYGTEFPYFNYDPETGINQTDPGIVANILDYIGHPDRANFTWRDSFGVYTSEARGNDSWTNLLKWTTDTYDLSINKWIKNTERLSLGVAFTEPWFDATIIIIEKVEQVEDTEINFANWLKPFDTRVWWVTVATLFFSCFVYQFLELMTHEHDDRSYKKRFMDNLYLSSLNFTQKHFYKPDSFASKIFGVSFSFWAMLIGAAYTANLASLLVETHGGPHEVQDINEAILRDLSMCTHEKAAVDDWIKAEYPKATREPLPSIKKAYDGVNTGLCDLVVDTRQTWKNFQYTEDYNPTCNLKWVGREVHDALGTFATKIDLGIRCTGLVNEVLNYWLSKMNDDKLLQEQWKNFSDATAPNCNANRRERRLSGTGRKLKGGEDGGATMSSVQYASDEDDESGLTIEHMAGIFLLHLVGSSAAILVAIISYFRKKGVNQWRQEELEGFQNSLYETILKQMQNRQLKDNNALPPEDNSTSPPGDNAALSSDTVVPFAGETTERPKHAIFQPSARNNNG